MGAASTAALNSQLTAFAVGYMSSETMAGALALAERIAPTVRVPSSTGQYKVFDVRNGMTIYDTARALGGDPRRIGFDATDATFNCKPQALEVTVDEEEVNQAGPGNQVAQQLLDTGKIQAVLNAAALAHAKAVTDLAAAVSAESGLGVWSNADIDPVDQIDSVLDDIATKVGSTQFLKLTLSLTAWRTLRSHPKIKARTTGVKVSSITLQDLAGMFAIPCDVQAHAVTYDTTKEGQTTAKARLASSSVFIHYSVPSPTVFDVSGFKTFTTGDRMITDVRTYEAPNGFYRGHVVGWSRDIKQTSTLAFRRIALS